MNQLLTLLGKNFTLHFRSRTFWINLYIPILSILISQGPQISFFVQLLPIFICLNNNGIIRQTIYLFVQERTNKSKEFQIQMGLNIFSYYSSWIITAITLSFVISLIYLIPFFIMELNNVGLVTVNAFIFIYGDILYTIALSSFMLFLSIFFESPLKASEFLSLLNVISSFASYVNFYPYPEYSVFGQLPALFLPQSAFQMLLFSQYWIFNQNYVCLSKATYITFLIFQIIFYLFCFIYFDLNRGILKNKIWNCFKKQNQLHVFLQEETCDQTNGNGTQQLQKPFLNIQQQDYEIQGQSIIKTENLSYQIGEQSILKSINLDIYQNETYCLVGPQKTGKSTLIKILQGLIQKTSGQYKLFGQDFDKNAKKYIGICMQQDILYEDLTVLEHLQFYGTIKGIDQEQLNVQINIILNICQLIGEINLKACKLNGLNSRKLCLAISMIGNPQVLFYDEPSQNLDAYGKQQIWQLLKQIRLNRTIVFTSQYFEEAENIANRMGVLLNGQIVAQGTPEFIQNNFGIGYNLNMQFKDENQLLIEKPKIQSQLQQIDSLIQAIQRNETTLFCVLPINKIDSFHQLFYYLEQNSKCSFSLKYNQIDDCYKTIDCLENQDNLDFNAQGIFQQQPQISLKCQIQSLIKRKLLLIFTEKEKQLKYIFLYFLITLAVMFGMFSAFRFVFFYLGIKAMTCVLFTDFQFEEKNTQMKQFLLASGVPLRTYWISTLSADMIVSFFEGIYTASLLWIYNVGHFGFHFFGVILLITLFGFSLSCQVNYFMQKQKSGNYSFGIPFLSIFVFYLIFLCVMLGIAQPGLTPSVYLIAMLMMIVSPYMACYIGFGMSPSLLNLAIFGYWSCLLFLLIGGFIYFLILITTESKQHIQIEQEMHDTNAVIDLQDVQWQYGTIVTKEKINMQINKQEIFGLVGPKNAGKTQLINLINNYDKPVNGKIRIRDQYTHVGLVPQYSIFKSLLTVQQMLEFFGNIKGQQNLNQSIDVFLKAFDIFDIKQKQIQHLNEIEIKKLHLGMALMGGSNRLFLDEILQGLDLKSRRKVSQIIQQTSINNEAAILLTTQSISDVLFICNRIGIFINGVLIAQGTINDLQEQLGKHARFSVRTIIGYKEQTHAIICQTLQQLQFHIQPIFDIRENFLSYMIPASQFRMSNLFSFLQLELKFKSQLITEFQIYEPNLEQTFEFFATQQMMILKPHLLNQNIQEDFVLGFGLRSLTAMFCIFW
ncbi:unnamed protein product [Paramecium primaurelia]|uniref:ABC transporter domain-containing protein n=1 Tax=Paramecium primaurelia TaxID=5886 RepID=A0A8S1K2V5_PARPR|nr:unnamed protein product [Paramecium primaurelia]